MQDPVTPLAQFRRELLYIAFDAASAIPVDPHVKDRGLMQEKVALAWVQLGEPGPALRCAKDIIDWRRGAVLAEVAKYAAVKQVGKSDEIDVDRLIEEAIQISNSVEDWRRDQIKSTIAAVYALRGETDKSAEIDVGLVDSEAGKADEARAWQINDEDYDKFVERLDGMIALGQFDRTRSALNAYTILFDRHFENKERRSAIADKVVTTLQKLPVIIRIETMLRLSVIASKHDDRETAASHLNEAQAIMDNYEWSLEDRVALMARVARARHEAGDSEKARAEAHAALEKYLADSAKIPKVFRAEALRPLAETYQAMGDHKAALDVCKIVVEDGANNINSRPRALDLTATCILMAVNAIEPDEALLNRVREIRAGLGNPW